MATDALPPDAHDDEPNLVETAPRLPSTQRPTPARALSVRQERFIEEYLLDPCGSRAAVRAGFSRKNAKQQAARLLARPDIRALIDEARVERAQRTTADADRVVAELQALAYSDIADAFDRRGRLRPIASIPATARRAISSVKVRRVVEGEGDDAVPVEVVEVRLRDKAPALKLLAQHLGMLVRRVQLEDVTPREDGGDWDDADLSLLDTEQLQTLADLLAIASGKEPKHGKAAPSPPDIGNR